MATTLNAVTFMGKSYSTMQNVVQNEENLTLKQMFDITAQTIHNEEEIYCLDKVVYQKNSWTQLSLINDPVIISLQSTKVYVFSDSVLCLGKVLQHPECNEACKSRVAGVRAERNYSDFDDIKGESAEFEWNIFPGFTSLQLCDRISNLLSSLGQSPETFTGRILFMSMFNDISCDRKDNKEQCLKNAEFVKTFAKRFGIGQWSFIGPGSEKKWYPSENSPQGEWDHIAEEMLLKCAESGHPIFRSTTPLSRGKLKSKGKGKVSIHFSADQDTVDTIYRIILSVNQLSIYGAVAAICNEYEGHPDSTGQPVILVGQSIVLGEIKAEVPAHDEKLEKISAWNLTKVKSKKQVIDEARTAGATVHFASLMDICPLKNAELEAKHQKYKGRVVLRGDIVKDNSGSYAVFTEQGSSASQMTAAKIMDIISRLPGCDGQAADAVSAFPSENERCSQIIENSQI